MSSKATLDDSPTLDKNDGGPAFPAIYGAEEPLTEGMTLRDYFAATVDIPWAAVMETLFIKGEKTPTVDRMCEYRAVMRFCEADAMLKERAK